MPRRTPGTSAPALGSGALSPEPRAARGRAGWRVARGDGGGGGAVGSDECTEDLRLAVLHALEQPSRCTYGLSAVVIGACAVRPRCAAASAAGSGGAGPRGAARPERGRALDAATPPETLFDTPAGAARARASTSASASFDGSAQVACARPARRSHCSPTWPRCAYALRTSLLGPLLRECGGVSGKGGGGGGKGGGGGGGKGGGGGGGKGGGGGSGGGGGGGKPCRAWRNGCTGCAVVRALCDHRQAHGGGARCPRVRVCRRRRSANAPANARSPATGSRASPSPGCAVGAVGAAVGAAAAAAAAATV